MEKIISNYECELNMDYTDTMSKMKNEQDIKQLKKYEKKLNLISNIKKYNIAYLNFKKLENVVVVEVKPEKKSKSKKKSEIEDDNSITLKNK